MAQNTAGATFTAILERSRQGHQELFSGIARCLKFKKRGTGDSFRFPDPKQFNISALTNRLWVVTLPKIGKAKFRESRDIEGRVSNVTVSRDGKKWYISLNCETSLFSRKEIGID